jgi:formate--tetrahydrofolate ligase
MRSSLEIAQSATPRPISEIAEELGLLPEEIEPYGRYKAKVSLAVLDRLADRPDGREVIVTAITPTPLGEGKTTTTIGLVQGLRRMGIRAAVTIRQPSLGPVFGIKGGGAGGGYSQVLPMEDVNLHFTGDIHAVSAAHDLAAAFLDNHLLRGNELGIDTSTIRWPRVLDVNDRILRRVRLGVGEGEGQHDGEFHITAASEVMAVLALADDLRDLCRRLGRVIVADTAEGTPVTLDDLRVAGAMAVLLRDAIMPNLVQTTEGGPAFVHAGPFANIAHGNSSVVADRVALKLNDVVCTEGGFAADMGLQRYVDIKCRLSGLRPSAAVIVATIRALKMHGGVGKVVAGQPLDPSLLTEDPAAVREGAENLRQHLAIVANYHIPVVVAINAFPTDHASEYAALREVALEAGAEAVVMARHYAEGGAGARELAEATWAAAQKGAPDIRFLSGPGVTLRQQIEDIAIGTVLTAWTWPQAVVALTAIERLATATCRRMARHVVAEPRSRPEGRPAFRMPVRMPGRWRRVRDRHCGNMMTMPGLPWAGR